GAVAVRQLEVRVRRRSRMQVVAVADAGQRVAAVLRDVEADVEPGGRSREDGRPHRNRYGLIRDARRDADTGAAAGDARVGIVPDDALVAVLRAAVARPDDFDLADLDVACATDVRLG